MSSKKSLHVSYKITTLLSMLFQAKMFHGIYSRPLRLHIDIVLHIYGFQLHIAKLMKSMIFDGERKISKSPIKHHTFHKFCKM